jgi:hypothetical protein
MLKSSGLTEGEFKQRKGRLPGSREYRAFGVKYLFEGRAV